MRPRTLPALAALAAAAAVTVALALARAGSAAAAEARGAPAAAPTRPTPAAQAAPAARGTSPTDLRTADYPLWETVAPGEDAGYNQRASLVQRGKAVYQTYCVGCHGPKGDGQGPAAKRLLTQPRDFRRGIYKFRSTDSSSLPLETDLHRTITRGLPRASMPGFPLMPEPDKLAVIAYLTRFYPRWDGRAGERVVVPVPRAPLDLADPARIGRGRVAYVALQCGSCHGDDGRGGSQVFTDAWGHPQRAFDFTRGRLKGGDDPEDVFRTFNTGLVSIMPAFDAATLAGVTRAGFAAQEGRLAPGERDRLAPALLDFPADAAAAGALGSEERAALGERNSWDLVAYVRALGQGKVAPARAAGGTR